MSDIAELLRDPAIRKQYAQLPEDHRTAFAWRAAWLLKAHKFQIEPPGDWAVWLCGDRRGFWRMGRTRARQSR